MFIGLGDGVVVPGESRVYTIPLTEEATWKTEAIVKSFNAHVAWSISECLMLAVRNRDSRTCAGISKAIARNARSAAWPERLPRGGAKTQRRSVLIRPCPTASLRE